MLKEWDESSLLPLWNALLNINVFNAQLVAHENKQASIANIWTFYLSMGGVTFPVIILLLSGWLNFLCISDL